MIKNKSKDNQDKATYSSSKPTAPPKTPDNPKRNITFSNKTNEGKDSKPPKKNPFPPTPINCIRDAKRKLD